MPIKKTINLGKYNNNFKESSKIFYNCFKSYPLNLKEDSIKALTTMLTMFEINKNNGIINKKDIEKNAKKYTKNIFGFLQINNNIPDDLEGWLLLFAIAVSNDSNPESLQKSIEEIENNRDNCEEAILNGLISLISDKIEDIAENEHELIKALHTELKDLMNNIGNSKEKTDLINFILKQRSIIIERLKEKLNKSKIKNKLVEKLFLKVKVLSFIYYKRVIKSSLPVLITKNNNTIRSLMFNLIVKYIGTKLVNHIAKQIGLQKKQEIRKENKLKKYIKKKFGVSQSETLWNMIHSHNPIMEDKLPEIIAGNVLYKREARRLKNLGVNTEFSHRDAHKNVEEYKENKDKPNTLNYINNKKKSLEKAL